MRVFHTITDANGKCHEKIYSESGKFGDRKYQFHQLTGVRSEN